MDQLDLLLLDAWNRIGSKVRNDRIAALKRSRRRFNILMQPMRAWCLAIRASDMRITHPHAVIEPYEALDAREPHQVTLDGRLIRELTKPGFIPWPGVTYAEAAKQLGFGYQSLVHWAHAGVLRVDYYRHLRRRDGREPIVWTPSPIDLNHPRGRVPHPVWGTLWQHLHDRLPVDYLMHMQRIPRFGTNRYGRHIWQGWYFICPGRMNRHGGYEGCGRKAIYLYGPQSVWTLAHAIPGGDQLGLQMPEDSQLAGEWIPGLTDPIKMSGPRSFACRKCWRVRNSSWSNHTGWNEFIAHISGGLLYGKEVPRPPDICPIERKRPYIARPDMKHRWLKRGGEAVQGDEVRERREVG